MKADLILYHANIITMDRFWPKAELIAIRGNKILALAENAKLKDLADSHTLVIDCHNKTVLPGFMDAHAHVHALAESFVNVSLSPLRGIRSLPDIQAKIKNFSATLQPGNWIRAAGYNEFYLAEKRHPTRWDLDVATSLHPIKLTHRSGHAHVLNSLALQMSGISRETPDPPDGLIERDLDTGEPTGLLYGMGDFLTKIIPPPDPHQLQEGLKQANRELLSWGITSIQDASWHNNAGRWNIFRDWKESETFQPRLSVLIGLEGFDEYQQQEFPYTAIKNQLTLAGVKVVLSETTGQFSPPLVELNKMVLKIHQSGLQTAIHAIEETCIEAALTAIESALQQSPRVDHRHRIEHCSVCPPEIAAKIASLGVSVVTQPSFIYYHGERYLSTVPKEQLKYLYPLATLLKNEINVAGSSDSPVVQANPLMGIYAAVTRLSQTEESLSPQEMISPLAAIGLYTIQAARTTFEEKIKGSLKPGKLADLVVLSDDPTSRPAGEIRDMRFEMTILDGKVVWEGWD